MDSFFIMFSNWELFFYKKTIDIILSQFTEFSYCLL